MSRLATPPEGHPESSPEPDAEAPAAPLGFWEKVTYGLGTVGDQLTTNAINQTVKPVYNIVLGVSPTWVGFALMLGKIVDAFTDPLMGNISDNTRTRWGRRRPYLLWGTFACAFAFMLVWFAPPTWGPTAKTAYLVVTLTIVSILSTVYSVPWTALGMELTPDYHQRTQVMAFRSFFTKCIWFVIPWFWPWSQLDIFANPVTGMRWIGAGVALAIVASGLACFWGCQERYYKAAQGQAAMPLLKAARLTFRNRPFAIVLGLTLVQVIGISTTVGGLGLYISTYWVYGGDLKAGGTMAATIGTLSSVVGLAILPLVLSVSRRLGKRGTIAASMGLALVGSVLNWFMYTPSYPMLQLVPLFFFAPGLTAFWVVNSSMRADVVDHDEMQTRLRREGIYGSIGRWFEKLAFAGSFFLSGVILDLAGFDADLGPDQAPEALRNMRLAFSLMPAAFMVAGLLLTRLYPLSEEVMRGYRAELERRRGSV